MKVTIVHPPSWPARDAEVAELRERAQRAEDDACEAHDQRKRLSAEVEQLRAQLARVTEERDEARAARIAEADAMHREVISADRARDAARRELDAVRAANESVAVCAEHTSRVIGDGCLVCELDAVRERVRAVHVTMAADGYENMGDVLRALGDILRAIERNRKP